MMFRGIEEHVDTQDGGQHQRWQHAREKQGADRHARRDRVDDRGDAGRHDRSQHGRSSGQSQRKAFLIASFAHGGDQHRAQSRCVGNRRSAHPREHQAAAHIDVAQAARHAAQQTHQESKQPVSQSRCIAQVTGHDEQRDGQQRERVQTGHQSLLGNTQRDILGQNDVNQAGQQQGESDGNPQSQQDQHPQDQQAQDHEAPRLSADTWSSAAGS
jgi:hypothetical protein